MAESVTHSWKRHPVVKFLSSFKCGVTLLALVLAYACVMSAVPQLRGAVEMTEMEAFAHWLFVVLILALCLSVIVATLARIRFTVINAGVLTVHAGLLTLSAGALWYFGTKVEGDVKLRSPRVELISLAGAQPRVVAALLPETGETWSNVMPAFGGAVSLEVTGTKSAPDGSLTQATIKTQLGGAAAAPVELTANSGLQRIGDKLALRLQTFPAERTFYDRERAALFVRPAAGTMDDWRYAEIRGLPIFRERYLNEGYVLKDADGHEIPSKRTRPALELGPLAIPTGWFEHWRLPIAIPTNALTALTPSPTAPPSAAPPFDLKITGYVPYIADFAVDAVAGGTERNPAIRLRIALVDSTHSAERTLFAERPDQSLLETKTPIEFRWAASNAQREEWLTPLAGANELFIEVKDPPVQKRIAVQQGQTIQVEGTPYELTVNQLSPTWPLISPGFERATSPVAMIAVNSGQKRYMRTVIQRYPELTQDIDEAGMRRREGPYDPNLVLRYRTAQDGWIMIVGDDANAAGGRCEVGVFDTSGRVQRTWCATGQTQRLNLADVALDLKIADLLPTARRIELPVTEPLERRRANISARAASAIRLTITGRDALAGWSESRWCSFSNYPDDEARPIVVQPPGNGPPWEIAYSRLAHDLGAALTPGKLSVKFFPGRRSAESWRSEFLTLADGESRPTPASVYTNATAAVNGWTLFQSGAAEDHWSYTILGVGNRNGIIPMIIGCCMIPLGCLFAFYIKPILIRRRQEAAIAAAEARGVKHRPANVPVPAEVGAQ